MRPVLLYPDPLLKQCAPVAEHLDEHVRSVAEDLVDTMKAHERCVGLAAPQIGVKLRVLAVDVGAHPRADASHGLLVLINPVVTEQAGQEVGREGCLSLPQITADIRRAKRIVFEGLGPDGTIVKSWTSGFEARAILHELDHLDGVLILDRVASPSEIFQRQSG